MASQLALDRSFAVRFQGCLSPFADIRYGLPRGSPFSVFLFQFFINDIPLGTQDLLFMDDCVLFADHEAAEGVYTALQSKLDLIEAWARLNRVSFGVHKCWLLPHKRRARPPLSFFGEPIPCRNEVTYVGVKFLAPSRIGGPWTLKLHLKDLGNQIRQKSHILRHLRCPRLKIPTGILRSLFQGWIGGLIRFSLPIFSDNADSFLEASFRLALRALTGLPPKCPNSALYVAANIQPVFHLRLAAGYRGIGRLLALPRSHPVSQCFWSWVLADPADPIYKATSSSFALERDALGHLYPEIVEDPNLRFDYEIDEAAFASNPFADIGQSSRFIKRFTQDSPSHSAIQIWTDGSFRSQDLNGDTACLIWTQGYDVPQSLWCSHRRRSK